MALFTLLTGVFALAFPAISQSNVPPAAAASTNRPARAARPPAAKQAQVAATNLVFGTISTNEAACQSALEAHALDEAKKFIGTNAAFRGTVAKLFEPGGMAILEFDADYKTALTAIVRGTNFAKFPALTNLIGRNVVVSGPFIDYRGKAEVVLQKPEQIKVVK